MDDVKYNLIEKYLSGELSGSELEDFESQLKIDASLQEELDLHLQVAETLKGDQVHHFRTVLKKVDQDWQSPGSKKNAKVFSLSIRRIAAFAAVAMVLIIAFQVFGPKTNLSNEALFADNFEPYKMILNQRSGASDPLTDSMNAAVGAYERKEFETASRLFQGLEEKTPDNGAYRLYIANAELSLGNTEIAIKLLEQLVKDASPLFIEQSRWYLALAYLQKGDMDSTKKELQQIKSGAFNYKEAQKLLALLQ
jgi:tetratricopeptide repeat protein